MFFYPVEFDADGNILYEDQLRAAKIATKPPRDIIIFVHGWDKTAGSAERAHGVLYHRQFAQPDYDR